ncbi:D-alanyl-D-alanine carboxypeptidase family protein [Timonella sp. A28]|uniref:M15 family metallopeptidase n=1 Tax=Timonella sp. A28 TaxID=3442640 RepID=UPI003EBBCD74
MASSTKKGRGSAYSTANRAHYQGRRAQRKPHALGRPVIVAGAAFVGIVGVTAAQAAQTTTIEQTVAEDTPKAATQETVQEIVTSGASDADHAVMRAAEVLSDPEVISASNKSVQSAAQELETLLADLEDRASTDARAEAAASRSTERTAIDETVDASGGEETPAQSETAETEQPEEPAAVTEDATQQEATPAVEESASPESVEDHTAETSLVDLTALAGDVTAATETYVGKHAADESDAASQDEQDAEQEAELSDVRAAVIEEAQTQGPLEDHQATVIVDEGAVSVDLSAEEIKDVEVATAKLKKLLDTQTLSVVPAKEIVRDSLEVAWEKAIKLAGSTSGYSNGQLPTSAMSELKGASGHYARKDAALLFNEMNKAFKAKFGRNIKLTDSYRSYGSQVATKAAKGWLAATPGTSNHGWGLALDLSGAEATWGTAERNWLVKNGSKYGWISPDWAQTSKPEPWHWEFAGAEVSAIAKKM